MQQKQGGFTQHYKNSAGFTLIELLMVISIIALLSSVVLASVSSARQKAIDTVTNTQIKNYTNVLLQLRDSNGAFPGPGTFCLGKNTTCPNGGVHNSSLDNAIDYYLPGSPPINNPPVSCISSTPSNGLSYYCVDPNNCTQISMYWCVQGITQCAQGATFHSSTFGNTYCIRQPFP